MAHRLTKLSRNAVDMNKVMELVAHHRLVAIIRLDDLSQAVEISQALLAGGIVVQEYTMTNPAALETIETVLSEIAEFSTSAAALGLGSVRDARTATKAIAAGVQFVVTPIVAPDVIETCLAAKVPVMSGAFTPTEIATAWQLGSAFVKVFPARQLGATYIKDLLAPMPDIRVMPTGGIDLENMADYFRAGAKAVGIGGNLIDPTAIKLRDWNKMSLVAQQYAQRAQAGAS